MTATAPNPPSESTQEVIDSALKCIADAGDFYEFEQAWIHGLRRLTASGGDDEGRSRLLAESGRRLKAFDEMPDDIARRGWLRDVVEEVRLLSDAALGGELAAVVANELREAFTRARPDIADLRAAVTAGETMEEFAIRRTISAERVRDLGRIAEGLGGSHLLALVPAEDVGMARELARAMIPQARLLATVTEPLPTTRG